MKKILTSITAIALVVSASVTLSSWNDGDQTQMSSGAPAGVSNDPANGNQNCTNCHSDFAPFTKPNMITSNIPFTGYVPNTTYLITATIVTDPLIVRFGFENTAQNASGTADLGTLIPIGTTETQLKTGTYNSVAHKYITHKSTSNSGNGGRVWTYNWTAPATGLGPVTFYGAFNVADNSGDDTGDSIYVSNMTVAESALSVEQQSADSKISIFPSVTNGTFTIQNDLAQGADYTLSIFNIAGENVFSKTTNANVENINLNVQSGLYFVTIKTGSITSVRKIMIQ